MIEWVDIDKFIGIPDLRELSENTQKILQNKQYKEDSKFEKSQLYKLEKLLKDYNPNNVERQGGNDKFDLEVEYRKRFLKNLIAKYW